MTELTPEEREEYAPPGTYLRRMLDQEVVPWPTREELEYENVKLALLRGEEVTIGTVTLRMEALEGSPRSPKDARTRHAGPPPPSSLPSAAYPGVSNKRGRHKL